MHQPWQQALMAGKTEQDQTLVETILQQLLQGSVTSQQCLAVQKVQESLVGQPQSAVQQTTAKDQQNLTMCFLQQQNDYEDQLMPGFLITLKHWLTEIQNYWNVEAF